MNFTNQLARFLSPVTTRIKMMLSRSVIEKVNDGVSVQQLCLSLLPGELRDNVENFQNYGFTSHPLIGMEAFTGFINGERSNPVVVAVADRKFRVKELEPGEVAIYTDEGDTIILKRGRQIEVKTKCFIINADTISLNATESISFKTTTFDSEASSSTNITTPNLNVSGSIASSEIIEDKVGSMQNIRDIFNSHTHNETDSVTSSPNKEM